MDSTTPAAGDGPVPGSWADCRLALLATSHAPVPSAVQPRDDDDRWPAVVTVGDDARIDRVGGRADGTHVYLLTTGTERTLVTLRVTPEAACALVSALMPAATRSATFMDALREGIDFVPPADRNGDES